MYIDFIWIHVLNYSNIFKSLKRINIMPKENYRYTVKNGSIKASLEVEATNIYAGFHENGFEYYSAQAIFSGNPVTPADTNKTEYETIIKINYKQILPEHLFRNLKRAEEGLEMMLNNNKWKDKRKVISCILLLEQKAQELYKGRAKRTG